MDDRAHWAPQRWYDACQEGHVEIAVLLIDARANLHHKVGKATPMCIACRQGASAASSYSPRTASAAPSASFRTVKGLKQRIIAAHYGHLGVVDWLSTSHHWSTALHHVEIVTPERATAAARWSRHPRPRARLLRRDAVLARPGGGGGGRAKEGTTAFLILEAAKPWSRQTHKYFPAPARARAVEP